MSDDNKRIIKLIRERMKKGKKAYGHGLRVHDDTRTWGTEIDSWNEMGLEEALDLNIYLSAQLLRIQDAEKAREELDKRRAEHVLKMAEELKRYQEKYGLLDDTEFPELG